MRLQAFKLSLKVKKKIQQTITSLNTPSNEAVRTLTISFVCKKIDDWSDVLSFTVSSIYHINGSAGHGSLTFDLAKEACNKQGAELPTYDDLYAAWSSEGLDGCNLAWLADGSVRCPIQGTNSSCSLSQSAGVYNGGTPGKNETYDAYCTSRGKSWLYIVHFCWVQTRIRLPEADIGAILSVLYYFYYYYYYYYITPGSSVIELLKQITLCNNLLFTHVFAA